MFLGTGHGIARGVIVAALAAALSTLLSACGIRYDESFPESARSRPAAQRRSVDARAVPSYRQQRQTRASIQEMEKMHRKMNAAGADVILTNAGASSDASAVKFVAEANALNIEIVASDNLNLVDGSPHALVLTVYHLVDRAQFDHLARNEEGIVELLEGAPFDDRSVRAVKQIDIQPGMRGIVTLDRPDNGRFVALVAGYNNPKTHSSVAVHSYPIAQFTKYVRSPILKGPVAMFTPERLDLRVSLDEAGMSAAPADILVNNFLDSRKMSFAETQRHLGVY